MFSIERDWKPTILLQFDSPKHDIYLGHLSSLSYTFLSYNTGEIISP